MPHPVSPIANDSVFFQFPDLLLRQAEEGLKDIMVVITHGS